MAKIRVGIWGYGNLGQSLERLIIDSDKTELVGIFSKRKLEKTVLNTPVYLREDILAFKERIDIVAICSGSKEDMLEDAPYLEKHFNIINTFDTHELISSEFKKLDDIAKENNTICIMSAGWDPGLFSQIKAIFYSVLNVKPICFWGKGLSLGHTNAVKNIEGVLDAVSLTIPNKKAVKLAKKGELVKIQKHLRKVYVVADVKANKGEIRKEICNIENYFKNQSTIVNFVNQRRLNKLKKFSHAGKILAVKNDKKIDCRLSLEISMSSNQQLTAMIVMSYISSFDRIKNKYKSGAYTPLHFSPIDIVPLLEQETIKMFC